MTMREQIAAVIVEDRAVDNWSYPMPADYELADAIIAALPGMVPDNPTERQISDACMWYRHDFGLLDGPERNAVMHSARYWLDAWRKVVTKP